MPLLRGPPTLYISVDIMSACTTPASVLCRTHLGAQSTSIFQLPRFEKEILSGCCPIPLPMLAAIMKTSTLRENLYQQSLEHMVTSQYSAKGMIQAFKDLLAQVERFDAVEWADRVVMDCTPGSSQNGKPLMSYKHSTLEQWTSFAKCYRSAASLYLIRSSQKGTCACTPGNGMTSLMGDLSLLSNGTRGF